MEWKFYAFLLTLIGLPLVLFGYGVVINSVGLAFLGGALCFIACCFALWCFAQLGGDL